jgi:hypothetical protein
LNFRKTLFEKVKFLENRFRNTEMSEIKRIWITGMSEKNRIQNTRISIKFYLYFFLLRQYKITLIE